MSNQTSWGKLGDSSNRSGGKVNNLKLVDGFNHLRFVGEPVEFHKYFVNGKSAVTADPNTCPIKIKYGIEPQTRYAINVIDRKDGQLKVLECSITVLKAASKWGAANKRDVGGDSSIDFAIEAVGTGKNRRYTSTTTRESVLTAEEKEMILKTGGTPTGYDLSKLYKATPENEIEARLFGGATPSKNNVQPTSNVGQTTQVKNVDIPF
jgi:hypothetical protein